MQGAIFQSAQTAPVQRQAETASEQAQNLAAQQFAAKVEERSETVQETESMLGNRVEESTKKESNAEGGRKGKRQRQPGDTTGALEESVLGATPVDGDHLIDFTA